jgi:hypothetical protein
MAFSFDSLSFDSLAFDLLAALVLLAVSIWSWRMARRLRAGPRVPLRFAAVLLAALAASLTVPAPGLAFNVMLLTACVTGVALALAFHQRAPQWLSATALVVGFATGLIASLAAIPLLAFAGVAASAAYILSTCASRAKDNLGAGVAAMLGAISLLMGGLAIIDGGLAQAALFFAAALGLVTRALQKPVEDPDARIELLVGGKRA